MRYFSTCGINSKNSNTALAHYLIPPAPDRLGRAARIAPSAWRRGYTASSSVDRGVHGYRG